MNYCIRHRVGPLFDPYMKSGKGKELFNTFKTGRHFVILFYCLNQHEFVVGAVHNPVLYL